jgi:hypothetical protein
MSRAKGSVFIHFQEYVRKFHDEATLEAVVEKLPPQDQAVFQGLVIHGGWYPVGAWNRAVRTLLREYYPDPDAGMKKLAQFVANEDLNSVYKMVLRLGSPEFLMRRTSSLWNRYFDAGALTAMEVEPQRWRMFLEAPKGDDDAPDYFTCGPGVVAWISHGLKLTGTHGVLEHVKCRLASGPHCEYTARW